MIVITPTFILASYVVLALLVFLIVWRGFDTDFMAALWIAVLGTGALSVVIYLITNAGRLF